MSQGLYTTDGESKMEEESLDSSDIDKSILQIKEKIRLLHERNIYLYSKQAEEFRNESDAAAFSETISRKQTYSESDNTQRSMALMMKATKTKPSLSTKTSIGSTSATQLPTGKQDTFNEVKDLSDGEHDQYGNRRNFPPSYYMNVKSLSLQCDKVLRGHRGKIYVMDWNPHSPDIVSGARDSRLLIWDSVTGTKKYVIHLTNEFVMTCCYAPEGTFVASGGMDDICSIWDVSPQAIQASPTHKSEKAAIELEGHEGYISCCRFWGKDKIVTCSGDSNIFVWDLNKQVIANRYKRHHLDVMSIDVQSDNNLLLSGSIDQTCKLWDLRNNICVGSYSGAPSDINSVTWFPDGKAFASGADDGICRLYDTRARSIISVYDLLRDRSTQANAKNPKEKESVPIVQMNKESIPVTSVVFSKSGAFLIAAYAFSPFCVVWNTVTGEQMQRLTHPERVGCVRLSPDGTRVGTSCWDRAVRIWGLPL